MTMIIDFLKRLIPAIVITVSCMVLFVYAHASSAAIAISVIAVIGSWNIFTNTATNKFENKIKLIPIRLGLFFYSYSDRPAPKMRCFANPEPYLQKINTGL